MAFHCGERTTKYIFIIERNFCGIAATAATPIAAVVVLIMIITRYYVCSFVSIVHEIECDRK